DLQLGLRRLGDTRPLPLRHIERERVPCRPRPTERSRDADLPMRARPDCFADFLELLRSDPRRGASERAFRVHGCLRLRLQLTSGSIVEARPEAFGGPLHVTCTCEDIAADFADLIAWRDRLYELHRRSLRAE